MIAAACAVASPTVARGNEPLPDSATIREKSTAAYGEAPPDYHDVVTYAAPAYSGKTETYKRGNDFRVIDDAGPLHTESGFVGGERWHQNANGHTVLEAAERAAAGREPTTTTVSRVTAPVDAYLIATLTKAGRGTRDYYDPTTYFLVRRDVIGASGTIVYEYGPFKAFGNRRLAAHWTRRDETSKKVTTYDRTVYTDDDPGAAAVAMPLNRRRLVEFPADAGTVDLGARLTSHDQWIVRVMIGTRGLDFTLDTGAYGIVMNGDVARELGFSLVNQTENTANAARFATGSVIVPEIHVGALTLHDAVVDVAPIAFNDSSDIKCVGLLGFDFLAESRFTLDYAHKRITVTRYENAKPPADPQTEVLDVRLNSQQPYVATTVNGVKTDRMIFDTGAVGSMLFFDSFVRRHPDALPNGDRLPGSQRFFGVGGTFDAAPYVVPHLRIGRFDFTRFVAFKSVSASAYDAPSDGLLGPDFFKIFTVDLDYPNGRIYLTPNDDFHANKKT